MKVYILQYQFLNTECTLEYKDIYDFARKLDAVQEMEEVNQASIVIKTEER